MVDSRKKGYAAELAAKKILIKYTGLNWQRTPLSGALDEKHGLKGDLYIPDCKQRYCVEVKHYKDDHLTSKILTSKNPILLDWWAQTVRESVQVDRRPLLLFKFDRSKWFVATNELMDYVEHFNIHTDKAYLSCALLENWLSMENPVFTE